LAADCVTAAKIGDDVIDSEHYAAGSIDAEHLAADCVTAAKIGDDVIDSEHYAAGSIDAEHLAADCVTAAKIGDDVIDSEHIAAGSIDTEHFSSDCITADEIGDDVIDSEHYAAASIDYAHIQNVAANSVLGRNANSTGVVSAVALATTEILIGDGTGFTAAALSGDVEMNNAGVVAVGSASGDFTVTGDLTVNGTTTTISTANALIEDKFTTVASGSTSSTDGGFIVQGAASAGYGLGWDSTTSRWGLDADLSISATNLVPDAFIGIHSASTVDPSTAPSYGGATYGHGNIHVNSGDSTIWIYA